MEVRIRSWCCQLSTFVTVVVIIQTSVYLVMATLTVAWVVLPYTLSADSFPWLGQSHLRQSVTVLIISLLVSASGILSSLLLLVGVRTQSRHLLLPWMGINVGVLLALLGAGSYLVIFFTLVQEEKDYMLAIMSSSLILLSMFLIYITVLVVQLFLKMKQKQLLVRVASSFRGSRASVNQKYRSYSNPPMSVKSDRSSDMFKHRSNTNTPVSVRSKRSDIAHKNDISQTVQDLTLSRSRKRRRHQSDPKRRSYRVHEFSCKIDLPKHKSRSLEHILDSSQSNCSIDDSIYHQKHYTGYAKSLPRLRPSPDYPHMYKAEYPRSDHQHTQQVEYQGSDHRHMYKAEYPSSDQPHVYQEEYKRSNKTNLYQAEYPRSDNSQMYQEEYPRSDITQQYQEEYPRSDQPHLNQAEYTAYGTNRSNKSVSIHPRVTEYHYSQAKENAAAGDVGQDKLEEDYSEEESVPAPIYPTQKVMLKNNSIEYNCAEGEFIL